MKDNNQQMTMERQFQPMSAAQLKEQALRARMIDDAPTPCEKERLRAEFAEWKEIDLALICEASKIHPDFSKMEQLVKDGADVNAKLGDDDENALSAVILDMENDDVGEDLPDEDSLPKVIEFFINHGFDPDCDEGRAGAKCLANLAFSRCLASKIPAMKLLLDAGFRNVPTRDAHDLEDAMPSSVISTEESYLRHQGDFESAKIYGTLNEMLMAKEKELWDKPLCSK